MTQLVITHYNKNANGSTVYVDGKPTFSTTVVSVPIKFGFGSYNEPMKVKGYDINVDDIISIDELV